jgi:hypothetical protein
MKKLTPMAVTKFAWRFLRRKHLAIKMEER